MHNKYDIICFDFKCGTDWYDVRIALHHKLMVYKKFSSCRFSMFCFFFFLIESVILFFSHLVNEEKQIYKIT